MKYFKRGSAKVWDNGLESSWEAIQIRGMLLAEGGSSVNIMDYLVKVMLLVTAICRHSEVAKQVLLKVRDDQMILISTMQNSAIGIDPAYIWAINYRDYVSTS